MQLVEDEPRELRSVDKDVGLVAAEGREQLTIRVLWNTEGVEVQVGQLQVF